LNVTVILFSSRSASIFISVKSGFCDKIVSMIAIHAIEESD
jgi:hypothetical protein